MELSHEKHTIGDDEVVQVHVLTNAQLRAAHILGI
jgi:hypothetical protein